MGAKYLTFLIIMVLSFLAKSSDRILRSKFFWAKTRFSEFLIWNLCSCFIILSIPLPCILRCIDANAISKFSSMTLTRMPLHCWSCCIWLYPILKGSVVKPEVLNKQRLATEFISWRYKCACLLLLFLLQALVKSMEKKIFNYKKIKIKI